MRVASALLLVEIIASSAASAAPPPSAEAVLSAAARAMARFDASATYEMRGSINYEGRTGDYREAVRMRDGAFVTHAQYDLFGEGEGYDGQVRWKQDRSAATHALNAPFSRADAVTIAWLKRRGFLQRGSAYVESTKHETIGGRAATVLTMRPRAGNSVHLAFDDSRHLLVRVERTRPLSTVTETYSDYRRVGGDRVPFRIELEESGDRQLIHLTRYERLHAQGRFSAPRQPRDTVITGPATIPLDSSGFAIIPARINGRDYDFILDTGGHNIVTPEVVAELGLAMTGKGASGGSGAGRVELSDTRIDKLELGSATLSDQHFYVIGLGDAVKRKDKPPLAGILGLEIFERMVVTLDEPHGRLIIEPQRSGRRCEGDTVPLLFDDDMPVVRGAVDGIPGLIAIDTGNGAPPAVLWRWAVAHRAADRFRHGIEGTSNGLGGTSQEWMTPHHEMVVGRSQLHDVEMRYVEDKAGYFSSRVDAVNLGRSLLHEYVVRFDYAQGHMCVRPKS